MLDELYNYKDEKYSKFQSNLIPHIPLDNFIGIRVPDARRIAKKYFNTDEYKSFIKKLPHKYYDYNLLHALLISEIKDYDECIKELDAFLPYVDNWAVCDIMSPKVFKKNTDKLLIQIKKWLKSNHTYTIRFAIEMLMTHYLDANFKDQYLYIPNIKSNDYYVNMMIAWFYATALSKRWDNTIKILESQKLELWVHNKTIQKACESNRITLEQKSYLKTLKK